MITKEILAKNILSKSKVCDYTVNAYTGCQHSCTYCYARFMKKFTGHTEPWGQFVDVKINAAELLEKEIGKKPKGRVWISGVCDGYQPLEKRYELTRKCIEKLVRNDWRVNIQTKSPLVLRDIELLKQGSDVQVGFTITTADDSIRKLFEPNAPTIQERIDAVQELHLAGISTFVMIAPLLPGAEGLPSLLCGKVDNVLVDRMNYHNADWVYKKYGLQEAMSDGFFYKKGREIAAAFGERGINCRLLF
ncbi:MAG: radical SAM protein [Atribacterota bacterium]|nr:radical SAM protein [Atribacterota bacterium]